MSIFLYVYYLYIYSLLILKIMNQILEIMDDIKQNITDKQYKTIMDSLKDIYENKKNS